MQNNRNSFFISSCKSIAILCIFLISTFSYANKTGASKDTRADTLKLIKLLDSLVFVVSDTAQNHYSVRDNLILQANSQASDSLLINYLAVGADSIGVHFRKMGNYLQSLEFHNWAWDLATEIRNNNLNSIILNNKGVVYRRLDDYEKALKYHIEALSYAEITRNIKSQAIAINSIGNVHAMIGNFEESLKYFKESLILEQKLNNLLGIAINLNNIGNIYSAKGDYKSALEFYNHSLEVNKEINSNKGIAICYNDLGNIYEKLGETDVALNYFLDALNINNQITDRYAQANSHIQVGELYTKLKQYDLAEEYLIPGLKIATEIGAKTIIMNGYHALSEISLAKQNYDHAFAYQELYHQYHDSIVNLNVHKEIARQQIRFDSEQKEKQIALLESNARYNDLAMKRQKTIILLAFSALIIAIGFVIFLLYFIFTKNKTNRLLLERNRIIDKTREELDNYSQQLLVAKHQAEENSKVKSEFLANMSHEIRTPLNSVIGFAEILSDSVSDPKHYTQIEIIKSSGRTLLNLINEILDLSKIEAGKFDVTPMPANPTLVIEDVINVFRQRAGEKNLEIKSNFTNLPNTILINDLRLRQVLFNLVGNALKFTNQGYVSIDAMAEPSIYEGHIKLTITVSDTGIGMGPEELNTIFEPFHQSSPDDNTQGTGLGLTITKRLVEAMNGSIDVNSKVGIGSEFTVCFHKIQLSQEEVKKDILHIPSIKSRKLVSALLITKDPDRCLILNIPGIELINKAIVTNLQEAKKEFGKTNVVIISGFKKENALNAVNVLSKVDDSGRVKYIFVGDYPQEIKDKTITYIDQSLSISEITDKLNVVFSELESPEKISVYFEELLKIKNNPILIEDLNEIYINEFTKATESKITNSIGDFVDLLKRFSEKHKLSGIRLYCEELEKSVAGFDIDTIEELLGIFHYTHNQLKN